MRGKIMPCAMYRGGANSLDFNDFIKLWVVFKQTFVSIWNGNAANNNEAKKGLSPSKKHRFSKEIQCRR